MVRYERKSGIVIQYRHRCNRHERESGIGYIGSRGGKHGGGLRGSHSGKKFSKTGHLWVTECKIFINGVFWALFRQNSDTKIRST